MPDLAVARNTNPGPRGAAAGGYYGLATPYFAAEYEMSHLPIPASLQKNVSHAWHPSGQSPLEALHEDVARFIEWTDNVK